MKYLLLATVCTIIGPWFLYAEILILKNGQKIEGDIVCELQESVVVWTRRGPLTVARNEIKSIETTKVQPQAAHPKSTAPSSEPQPGNLVKESDVTTATPKAELAKPQQPAIIGVPTVPQPAVASKHELERQPPGSILQEIVTSQRASIDAEPIPRSITAMPDALRRKIETAIEVFVEGEFEQQNLAQKELVKLKNKAVPYLGYLLRLGGGHKYYIGRLISTLQEIKTPQASEQLYLYVRKAGERVDLSAIKALGSYQNPKVFPLLKRLVSSSNASIMMAALDVLAQQTSPQRIPILVRVWVSNKLSAQNDVSMMVAGQTEELLKNLWDEAKKQPLQVGPILLKPLESGQVSSGPFQKRLIELIDFIQYTESVEFLAHLLNSQPKFFNSIVPMFGRFGTDAAQAVLVQLLEQTAEQDLEKKLLLLQTLSSFKLGTVETPLVPYLFKMLESEEPQLAQAAFETLVKYTGKNFDKNLTGWHYWWEAFVRLKWNDKSNLPQPKPKKTLTEEEAAAAEEKRLEAQETAPSGTTNDISESNTGEADNNEEVGNNQEVENS